jgi:hypothetical protein
MTIDQSISQFFLFGAMAAGAVIASLWLGIVIWTWRDMRARSRDMLAAGAATLMVGILSVFGLVIYLMLRPRETLAEAYERSLEEEALLQGIEEKPACPGCGRASNAHWQVCPYCHTRLKKQCIQCAQLLDLPWNLCPFCAAVQGNVLESDQRQMVQQARPRRSDPRRTAQSDYEPIPQSLEFIDGEDI